MATSLRKKRPTKHSRVSGCRRQIVSLYFNSSSVLLCLTYVKWYAYYIDGSDFHNSCNTFNQNDQPLYDNLTEIYKLNHEQLQDFDDLKVICYAPTGASNGDLGYTELKWCASGTAC